MTRLIAEPLPDFDPNDPLVKDVVARVTLEANLVAREYLTWTEHEVLREARRRCAALLTEVANEVHMRRSPWWRKA